MTVGWRKAMSIWLRAGFAECSVVAESHWECRQFSAKSWVKVTPQSITPAPCSARISLRGCALENPMRPLDGQWKNLWDKVTKRSFVAPECGWAGLTQV